MRDNVYPLIPVALLLLLLLLLGVAGVYLFFLHPSVEWLQSIDTSTGYINLWNVFDTLACNHAIRVCVGVPYGG